MKNIGKKVLLLVTAGLLTAATAMPVMAEHKDVNGSCYFDGTKIVSDYESKQIADAVTNLQPGDDVSFTVKYTNSYNGSTDWYMENKILQTLEKASASKAVAGTGQAEHGAYTYELIHIDNEGNREVLFSNRDVGGDTVAGGMEGLEQATNALDDWFFIQTLNQGESGTVILNVEFDGETEVNDYMDTDGGLAVRFAVELAPTAPTPTPSNPSNPTPTPSGGTSSGGGGGGSSVTKNAVKTGDPTNLPLIIGALVAGVVLLIVALVLRKKQNAETAAEDEFDDPTDKTGGQ